jgi:hypothetical protein
MRVLSNTDEQSDPVEVVAAQGSYRLFRK